MSLFRSSATLPARVTTTGCHADKDHLLGSQDTQTWTCNTLPCTETGSSFTLPRTLIRNHKSIQPPRFHVLFTLVRKLRNNAAHPSIGGTTTWRARGRPDSRRFSLCYLRAPFWSSDSWFTSYKQTFILNSFLAHIGLCCCALFLPEGSGTTSKESQVLPRRELYIKKS